MSWPYKITVRESVQDVVVVEDSVKSKLDLVPILPQNDMEEISRTILKEHGFEGEEKMSRKNGGVIVTVDPSTCEVEAKVEENVNIDLTEEDEGGGCPCRERNEEAIRESLRKNLKKKSEKICKNVQELVTGRLSRSLADIGCEMEQMANQITARAIKRKAQELGQIKKIHHNDNTGEVVIVVEV